MKVKIVAIGNSRGIRLPKSLIEQLGLRGQVHLETAKGALVIRPAYTARFDWAKAFHAMAEVSDDRLLDDYISSTWDNEEWEWK